MSAQKLRRTIDEIRREHYPLMVSQLQEYIFLHGDPAVVARALRDAALAEQERLKRERQTGGATS